MDLDDDQGMPDDEVHQEVDAKRPTLVGVPVPSFVRHGRLDSRYRMELGDQLTASTVEAGIKPANMRDIQADGRLLHMWRGMPHDMYSLMRHVVGATTLVMQLRRTVTRYRRARDVAHDRQPASNDSSSHDRSPHATPDE